MKYLDFTVIINPEATLCAQEPIVRRNHDEQLVGRRQQREGLAQRSVRVAAQEASAIAGGGGGRLEDGVRASDGEDVQPDSTEERRRAAGMVARWP